MTDADHNPLYYGKSNIFQQVKCFLDAVILQFLFTALFVNNGGKPAGHNFFMRPPPT
jgi:hypothetical protein